MPRPRPVPAFPVLPRPALVHSLVLPLALALAGLAALPVRAQAVPDTDDDPLTLLQQLTDLKIESVSRFAQNRLDAAAMVTIVDRPHIASHGYDTVADVLRNVPGIYLTSDRTYGGVGVRGFNRPGDYNARMLMLVDGQRINDVVYDQALPELEFPLVADWVRRLEFVSGPSSSVYGGNALFGVANLVTLEGGDVNGSRVRLSRGTRGSVRAVGEHGRRLDDGRDVFVGVAASRSEGDTFEGLNGPIRGLDGTRYAALLAKLRDGAWHWQLAASARGKDVATAPYGTPEGVSGTRYTDQTAFARLSWEPAARGDWQQRLQLSLSHYRFGGRYRYTDPALVNVDEADAQWLGAEYRTTWRGINHTVVLGVDGRHTLQAHQGNRDVDPPATYLDDRHRSHALGTYVQDEYRMAERWSLTSGLRVDAVDGRRPQASPRAALVYRPRDGQAFKLLAGSAFRAPNLAERYYQDGGASQYANPGLDPERITTLELGMEQAVNEHTRMAASLYHYRLKDLIEFDDSTLRYLNLARATTSGAELELEQAWPSGWSWRASAAVQRARSPYGRLSNSPTWLLKASAVAPLPAGWTAAVELDAIGHRLTRTRETLNARTLVNLNLRRSLAANTAVALRATNVGDVRYDDPAPSALEADRVRQPGRRIELSLEASF